MGYTHYWDFCIAPKFIDNGLVKFKQAVEATKSCISSLKEPVKLCDGMGRGDPIFSDTKIVFNGDESKQEDYEGFLIDIEKNCDGYCKTKRKPYDIAVCIALRCFKKVFGSDFSFRSDGALSQEPNWIKSLQIVNDYFNAKT